MSITGYLLKPREKNKSWAWKQEGEDFFVCHPTKGWRRLKRRAFDVQVAQMSRYQRFLHFVATLRKAGAS